MTRRTNSSTTEHPKTLLVPVQSPYNPVRSITAYFDEFIHLAASNNIHIDKIYPMKLRSIDSTYFFTKGKLEELTELCNQEAFEQVIISEPLSVQQERNLTTALRCTITDRTALILQIFEARATTAEGKLQVSLAVLQHKKSRLAGMGIHLSQQGGTIGTRGPGETQKERDMQHIEHLMLKIRREIKRLEQTRDTQRKQRVLRKIPLICLVGYTNAGKSSIMNMLARNTAVTAENQLFSTLTTTTRELYLESTKIGLLSDTVGFIQQLPPQLIAAFKATLDELHYAHLILHIIDIADPNWQSHIEVVTDILADLKIAKPTLYIFNKSDLLSEEMRIERLKESGRILPVGATIIWTSTYEPEGTRLLSEALVDWHNSQKKFSGPDLTKPTHEDR